MEKWLKDPLSHNYLHSPLDVIDPILKKDGDDSYFTGRKIEITPFAISYKKTQEIRKRVLLLISSSFAQESTRVKLRAIKSLMNMLHPPRRIFGREISEEEYSQWFSEEKEILNIFEDFIRGTHDPVIKVDIKQNLQWYAKFGRDPHNLQKSNDIIKKIRETFDVRLVRALLYSFDKECSGDYEKRIETIDHNIQKTVKDFISKEKSCDAVYSTINNKIHDFEVEKISINPGRFLYFLGELYPKQSAILCRKILSDSPSSLSQYYGAILSGIIESDKKVARQLIGEGMQSQQNSICRTIAFGYSNGWWQSGIEKDEFHFIKELLKSSDDDVKELAIAALAELPKSENQKIKRIALDLDIGNNFAFADALLKLFSSTTNRTGIELTKAEIEKIIMKLKIMPSLHEHVNGRGFYVCNFFNYASKRNPAAVISLFLERINYANELNERSWSIYEPIPITEFSHCIEKLNEHQDYLKLLKKVRDTAYQADNRGTFPILIRSFIG